MNKVILIGNLGADPEVKKTDNTTIANFSIATNETWKDKNGEKQEKTEWHRVVVFGAQADICGKYLAKGRTVAIEGKIQTRKWQDDKGEDRYSTEVVASRVEFVGGSSGGDGGAKADTPSGQEFNEAEIPF